MVMSIVTLGGLPRSGFEPPRSRLFPSALRQSIPTFDGCSAEHQQSCQEQNVFPAHQAFLGPLLGAGAALLALTFRCQFNSIRPKIGTSRHGRGKPRATRLAAALFAVCMALDCCECGFPAVVNGSVPRKCFSSASSWAGALWPAASAAGAWTQERALLGPAQCYEPHESAAPLHVVTWKKRATSKWCWETIAPAGSVQRD